METEGHYRFNMSLPPVTIFYQINPLQVPVFLENLL